jgi:hypothetical protein
MMMMRVYGQLARTVWRKLDTVRFAVNTEFLERVEACVDPAFPMKPILPQ